VRRNPLHPGTRRFDQAAVDVGVVARLGPVAKGLRQAG